MLNLTTIKDNLETKLNRAIVDEITRKQQANEFTPLESDRETYRFLLNIDTGEYTGYDYLRNRANLGGANGSFDPARDISDFPTQKFVRYINGNIEVEGSDVEGGIDISDLSEGITNLTFFAYVTFIIPITDKNTDVTELIGTLRTVIDNAMRLNTYDSIAGYNMSATYSLGTTGERAQRPGVGDSITLSCGITYVFVENGINSMQIKIEYGNSTIYAPTKAMSRMALQEGDVDLTSNNNNVKNTTYSTSFTLSFDKPVQYDDFDTIAINYLLGGAQDTQYAYPIKVTIPILIDGVKNEISKTFYLSFNEVSFHTANALNASMHIVMGEGVILNG